jgi:hypothetical protein
MRGEGGGGLKLDLAAASRYDAWRTEATRKWICALCGEIAPAAF